jgi:hypothetical protein
MESKKKRPGESRSGRCRERAIQLVQEIEMQKDYDKVVSLAAWHLQRSPNGPIKGWLNRPPPFTFNPNARMALSPDPYSEEYQRCEAALYEWALHEKSHFNELMCELMDRDEALKELAKRKRRFYKSNGLNVYLRKYGRENELA